MAKQYGTGNEADEDDEDARHCKMDGAQLSVV